MPVELTYLKDNGILIKGSGIITSSDISKINSIIYETPTKIKNIAYQLCDYSDVIKVEMSSEDVRNLANQDTKAAEINPDMFIAIVASGETAFGLSRMWEIMTNETLFDTHVFRNVKDAKEWIAVKLDNNHLNQ